MRTLIRRFDAFVIRVSHVFEFCDDPDCLLRLQLAQASHAIPLPGGSIPVDAKVLILHFWNEHMPAIPDSGPDLAWGKRAARLFLRSLEAVASYLQNQADMDDVQAIGGMTILLMPGDPGGGEALAQRFGFTALPYHNPLGWFGEFWENLYTWALIWTYNPVSLEYHRLFQIRRSEIWMSRREFLRRYSCSGPTLAAKISANQSAGARP
jgi:hypothetical protein